MRTAWKLVGLAGLVWTVIVATFFLIFRSHGGFPSR
jgi:hypothetical protein